MIIRSASAAELQFWTYEQLNPANSVSAVAVAFEIAIPVNLPALHGAVDGIVQRHEILRSRFESSAEGVRVVVEDAVKVALRLMVAADRDEAVAVAREIGQVATLLTVAPLLQVTMVSWAEDRHIVTLTSHHAALDGGSLNILIDELSRRYSASLAGKSGDRVALPELVPSATLSEVVAMEQSAITQRQWAIDLDHWAQELSTIARGGGLVPLADGAGHRARTRTRTLTVHEGKTLRAAARSMRASLTMVLLATWAQLLLDRFALSELVIGVPVSGRDSRDRRGTVGLLMNTVPLVVHRTDGPFRMHLEAVRRSFLQALRHRRAPFTHIARKCRPGSSFETEPLYNVMFTQGHGSVLRWNGLPAQRLNIDDGQSESPWSLVMVEEEGGSVRLTFQVKETEVESDELEQLVDEYMTRLWNETIVPADMLRGAP